MPSLALVQAAHSMCLAYLAQISNILAWLKCYVLQRSPEALQELRFPATELRSVFTHHALSSRVYARHFVWDLVGDDNLPELPNTQK